MAIEKVGDVVWYVVGDTTEFAKVIGLGHSRTEATIRLLTGKQKGQEFDAPWGVIESERKTTERYLEYFIEVRVRPLEDGAFTSGGFIRKPNPAGTGLPFETSFETTERHPTEDAARRSGLVFILSHPAAARLTTRIKGTHSTRNMVESVRLRNFIAEER